VARLNTLMLSDQVHLALLGRNNKKRGISMERAELNQEIGALLSSSLDRAYSDCAIAVELLDCTRDNIKIPFVMAAVDTPGSLVNRSNLYNIIQNIYRGFINSDYFDRFEGLEVIFRHQGSMQRIARVSVTAVGYWHILRFQVSDFDKFGPFSGVRCWVYDNALV